MPGTRQTNTFVEGLQKILSDITDLKLAPDADMQFVYDLETQVIQKIRAPQDQLAAVQAQQAGQGGMPSAPPMAPPGGGMDPSMMAGAMDPSMGGGGAMPGSGGGAPGGRMNPGLPPPDELRRLLGQ